MTNNFICDDEKLGLMIDFKRKVAENTADRGLAGFWTCECTFIQEPVRRRALHFT